mmetsp:Transcript_16152/g.47089  ORF Transcript_16152/g.47089 Transcript_16152/m.47089 type:complete len:403 (-) Transcript_16152:7-1215(-)
MRRDGGQAPGHVWSGPSGRRSVTGPTSSRSSRARRALCGALRHPVRRGLPGRRLHACGGVCRAPRCRCQPIVHRCCGLRKEGVRGVPARRHHGCRVEGRVLQVWGDTRRACQPEACRGGPPVGLHHVRERRTGPDCQGQHRQAIDVSRQREGLRGDNGAAPRNVWEGADHGRQPPAGAAGAVPGRGRKPWYARCVRRGAATIPGCQEDFCGLAAQQRHGRVRLSGVLQVWPGGGHPPERQSLRAGPKLGLHHLRISRAGRVRQGRHGPRAHHAGCGPRLRGDACKEPGEVWAGTSWQLASAGAGFRRCANAILTDSAATAAHRATNAPDALAHVQDGGGAALLPQPRHGPDHVGVPTRPAGARAAHRVHGCAGDGPAPGPVYAVLSRAACLQKLLEGQMSRI